MSTTQEHEAAEATRAVAWLETYLAEGPRYSAQLRRDALADGLQLPALHRAATELHVARIQAGRWSRWALARHAEATRDKRCPVCLEIKDREDFRRSPTAAYPAGRMLRACTVCTDARSTRTDASPATIEAMEDRTAAGAPDPGPAIALREELVTARRAGESFTTAWGSAMATALGTAEPRERDDWRYVLLATHGAWRAAYDRREDALAGHAAVGTLAEAA